MIIGLMDILADMDDYIGELDTILSVILGIIFLLELIDRIRERAIGCFVTRHMYFFWLTVVCLILYNILPFVLEASPWLGLPMLLICNFVTMFSLLSYILLRGSYLISRYLNKIAREKKVLLKPLITQSPQPRKAILWALGWSLFIHLPYAVMIIWVLYKVL